VLSHHAPADVLLRIADDCRVGGTGSRAIDEAVARSVSHAARMPEIPETAPEAYALLDELMACELPYTSPAGRPTMIHFAHSELDRKFGR